MDNETPSITKEEKKEINDSKRAQLSLLQSRLSAHGTRMWQLPLTYLGSLALAISAVATKDLPFPKWWVFALVFIVGGVALWCMVGAYEGYDRTVNHLWQVEKDLDLKSTTRHRTSHSYPYFLLIIIGMLLALIAAARVYPN